MPERSGVARKPHERLAQERRLRGVAEWRDISQAEIATELGESTTNWNRYEKGRAAIPDDVLEKAAVYYGVRRAYLLWGELPREAMATSKLGPREERPAKPATSRVVSKGRGR